MTTTPYDDAIANLSKFDLPSLELEIGLRQKSVERQPELAGAVSFSPTYDSKTMGPLDGVKDLGWKILIHWTRELHSLACGQTAADTDDRKKLRDSFGLTDAAMAGVVTTLLVNTFNLAPAIATVVAVIFAKRFARTAVDDICEAVDGWIKGEETKPRQR